MSTNYYLVSRNPDDTETFERAGLTYEYGKFNVSAHLCKKSVGWDPLFQLHPGARSVKALLRVIGTMPDTVQILDEYGTELTREQFREMVEEWRSGMEDGEYEELHRNYPGQSLTIDGEGFALESGWFA